MGPFEALREDLVMDSHAPVFLLHCQKQHCLTSICLDHYFLPLQIPHLYFPIFKALKRLYLFMESGQVEVSWGYI